MIRLRKAMPLAGFLAAAIGAGGGTAILGTCGPFTDFTDAGFCPFVLEIFYLGITTGTTPTTYDPAANVTRLQMAAFLSRGVDGVLKRGSRRAALNRFWTTEANTSLAMTTIAPGTFLEGVVSDGEDVWVAQGGIVTAATARSSRPGRERSTATGFSRPSEKSTRPGT
jgi:hypothetical protein